MGRRWTRRRVKIKEHAWDRWCEYVKKGKKGKGLSKKQLGCKLYKILRARERKGMLPDNSEDASVHIKLTKYDLYAVMWISELGEWFCYTFHKGEKYKKSFLAVMKRDNGIIEPVKIDKCVNWYMAQKRAEHFINGEVLSVIAVEEIPVHHAM